MSNEKLKLALKIWQDKLAEYEYELSITASPEQKFEMRQKIKECQVEIERLKKCLTIQQNLTELPCTTTFEIKPLKKEFEQQIEWGVNCEKKVDYTQLNELLAAGKWQQADRETATILLKVLGKVKVDSLEPNDIEKFPCEVLFSIDRLWMQYSNGRFGFSIQKEIFEKVEGNKETFCERVGWRKKEQWIRCHPISSEVLLPAGYFPCSFSNRWLGFMLNGGQWIFWFPLVVSRLTECELQNHLSHSVNIINTQLYQQIYSSGLSPKATFMRFLKHFVGSLFSRV